MLREEGLEGAEGSFAGQLSEREGGANSFDLHGTVGNARSSGKMSPPRQPPGSSRRGGSPFCRLVEEARERHGWRCHRTIVREDFSVFHTLARVDGCGFRRERQSGTLMAASPPGARQARRFSTHELVYARRARMLTQRTRSRSSARSRSAHAHAAFQWRTLLA